MSHASNFRPSEQAPSLGLISSSYNTSMSQLENEWRLDVVRDLLPVFTFSFAPQTHLTNETCSHLAFSDAFWFDCCEKTPNQENTKSLLSHLLIQFCWRSQSSENPFISSSVSTERCFMKESQKNRAYHEKSVFFLKKKN